jgi:hypothetical protein
VNSDSKSQGRKKRDIFNCNNLAFSWKDWIKTMLVFIP